VCRHDSRSSVRSSESSPRWCRKYAAPTSSARSSSYFHPPTAWQTCPSRAASRTGTDPCRPTSAPSPASDSGRQTDTCLPTAARTRGGSTPSRKDRRIPCAYPSAGCTRKPGPTSSIRSPDHPQQVRQCLGVKTFHAITVWCEEPEGRCRRLLRHFIPSAWNDGHRSKTRLALDLLRPEPSSQGRLDQAESHRDVEIRLSSFPTQSGEGHHPRSQLGRTPPLLAATRLPSVSQLPSELLTPFLQVLIFHPYKSGKFLPPGKTGQGEDVQIVRSLGLALIRACD
jgi:hypothetical protein